MFHKVAIAKDDLVYAISHRQGITHPAIEDPGSTGSYSWTAGDQHPETISAVPKLMADLAVAPTRI